MKYALILALFSFSFSGLAAESVEDVVTRVETERNASCQKESESRFKLCIGTPEQGQVCRWTMTFKCDAEKDFTLKLKVKSEVSDSTGERNVVVTKVTII